MRTLDERQKKILRIYDNLRHDAATFTPTAANPENFGRQLLDDFMQNEDFAESMRSIAVDFGRSDILKAFDQFKPQSAPLGFSKGLMAAVDRGDDDMLVDLIKQPATPTYSLAELQTFWNVTANIQKDNPELYTHMVADKRYVDMFEQTVAANEYSGEGVEKLRADVLKAHANANKTLAGIEYDKFQLNYTGTSDNLYRFIENSDFDPIGKSLTASAPQTIFSGLKITQPLDAQKLTEVSVSVDDYHNGLQAMKDPMKELKIDVPDVPPIAAQFNQFAAPPTKVAAPAVTATIAPPAPEPEEAKTYTVKQGDNLWNIAREQYGLKSYKDIMRAVDHIAARNDLDQGVRANKIDVGQELKMPTADEIRNPAQRLDWAALDADVAQRRQPQLAMALN